MINANKYLKIKTYYNLKYLELGICFNEKNIINSELNTTININKIKSISSNKNNPKEKEISKNNQSRFYINKIIWMKN